MDNNAVGGYFDLELARKSEYHQRAIRLNSGRHCLEYILRLREYRKIFIPYYTCEVMIEPITKLGLEYEFYNIDANLEPLSKPVAMAVDECFLYTNYFGLKDDFIASLPSKSNIIIDNSQGFFSAPCPFFDTFYSPRKFFGVPDGGYLFAYNGAKLGIELPQAESYNRCNHLLKRIDLRAEAGYADFMANDRQFSNEPMMLMSNLTQRILSSIDYERAKSQRIRNFKLYHKHLGEHNMLPMNLFTDVNKGPLIYPYLIEDVCLRSELISKRIFVPQYWPNVLEWTPPGLLEHTLVKGIVSLPVDQRYSHNDIVHILTTITRFTRK